MTESEQVELNKILDILVKKSVVWYREQDFSHMNDDARGEIESLYSDGEGYDPMASLQISLNMMMIGTAWQDIRLFAFAARATQFSSEVETTGKPESKIALRKLLDEISELLREPKFC